ncbi:MAG: hypothetical protein DLM57_02135 [Pseudonocardiales bacterium]|nr:MAG: hypothetical protein DLM57_02135 [Pseudonocardiales bacterium]
MQVRRTGPHARVGASSRRVIRRYTAAGAVATMAGALALVSPAAPANATPLATATFSGHATSSVLQSTVATCSVLQCTSLDVTVNADLGPTTAGVSRNASAATASNLLAKITGFPAIDVQTLSASAPPPQTVGPTTLIAIPAAPVLDVKALTGLATASWPEVGTCPAATVPASLGSVTTAAAAIVPTAGDRSPPTLIQTSAATTQSSTTLVSAGGPVGTDTRAVQAQATNTLSSVDLFGGADLPTGFTIDIAAPTTLTATATGVAGTSGVVFTPGAVTVEGPGSSPTVSVAPGATFTLPPTSSGLVTITGSIKVNQLAASSNTGTAVSADASLLTISLIASNRGAEVAAFTLAVAPLHVDATSPKDGIQCATAPTPPPTTVTPPTTPPIPSGAPQTGAGGTAGLQEGALIALGLVLLVSGAGAGSMAYRRRRTGHAA